MALDRFIRQIVDTRTLTGDDAAEESLFGRALQPEYGYARAWHVTDDPKVALRRLMHGDIGDVTRTSAKYDDYGPGLYVSAVPQFWSGRATSKWAFLNSLTPAQRRCLADRMLALPKVTGEGHWRSYLTESERRYLVRDLTYFRDDTGTLYSPLNQPFNLHVELEANDWKLVRECGIAPTAKAQEVEVWVQGMLGETDASKLVEKDWRAARRAGLDGVFSKSGMATAPQAVIWNARAIVRFGGWLNDRGVWRRARVWEK